MTNPPILLSSRRLSTTQRLAISLRMKCPQTVAVVLSNLKPVVAAEVFATLSLSQQMSVARRIVNMNHGDVDTTMLAKIMDSVECPKASIQDPLSHSGDVETMVAILRHLSETTRMNVIRGIALDDMVLAEKIRQRTVPG